ILLWVLARRVEPFGATLAAWVGMFGLILLLHFGSFHLIALLWRTAGIDATPLMRHPAASTSIAEFWGTRWNSGFRHLSHAYLFRPLARLCGVRSATCLTFLASGL